MTTGIESETCRTLGQTSLRRLTFINDGSISLKCVNFNVRDDNRRFLATFPLALLTVSSAKTLPNDPKLMNSRFGNPKTSLKINHFLRKIVVNLL